MGNVKEAFKRVKEDISSLNQEVTSLKEEINTLRESIRELKETTQYLQSQQNPVQTPYKQPYNPDYGFDNSTHPSTDRHKNSTDSTHPSTDNPGFKPLNGQNLGISTRNKGVSTDRQTHRQTHRQQDYANFRQTNYYPDNYPNSQPEKRDFKEDIQQNRPEFQQNKQYKQNITQEQNYTQEQHYPEQSTYQGQQPSFSQFTTPHQPQNSPNQFSSQTSQFSQSQPLPKTQDQQNNFSQSQPLPNSQNQEMNQEQSTMNNALEILNSLDSIKKEVRFKFKKLTDQEMSVFSALYQLGEENEIANYRSVSRRLNLSESSIRDYVGRLMKKGIPIEKKRINNKTIHLKISEDLKKIATLPTILKLRDL